MSLAARILILTTSSALLLSGCSSNAPTGGAETTAADDGATATATLQDKEGSEVGTVRVSEVAAGTELRVEINGLESGFYGFHVHGTGLCEPNSAAPGNPGVTGAFLSAGGHLGAEGSQHPEHAGDLPSVYVTEDGQGTLMAVTDRFTVDDLAGGDGTALMLHSGPDNFANISERYAPAGPDQDTLRTGDAGPRLACGVVE
ncbi:superoxide dismutase family protein [Pseudarthrobacter oxydans]|jgi:Cu-Zn family superoxide dismutase|uniref:superoxide dismutase family protein n=1 Tax=Pseudarthrobacter oxydans TaxID=1671 RepID=UPI0034293D11